MRTTTGSGLPLANRATGEPVIEGRGIVKRYGTKTVLDGATFAIGSGITGLLGSNGAGKTTLLGMTLGLHRPTEGALQVLGLDPAKAGPDVRARIGYAPEHHTLPGDVRAHDLVRHIAEVHGLPRRDATSRASDALWQVGLGEERFRPIATMSTGQRQRVKLAQAIAHDPALVLLDEPTDGLDPVQRDDMLTLIRRIGSEYGIDIVLSSHLLEEVERICDSAVILAQGTVVASGAISELTADVGHAVVVEVVDGLAELERALVERGATVVVDRLRLTASREDLDHDALFDLVRDALVVSGAGLRRLGPRRVTLEQVFLEVGT